MGISKITKTQSQATKKISNSKKTEKKNVSFSRKEEDKFVKRKKQTTIKETEKMTKGIPTEQFDTLKRISTQYDELMAREDARSLDEFTKDDGTITNDGRAVFLTPFEIPYKGVLYTKNKVVEYDEEGRPITVAINNSTEQKIIKYDYWSATVRRTEEKYEIVEGDDNIIPKYIADESKF